LHKGQGRRASLAGVQTKPPQVKRRGLNKLRMLFTPGMTAVNMRRLPKLLAMSPSGQTEEVRPPCAQREKNARQTSEAAPINGRRSTLPEENTPQ
jgi:hypothetical protein